MSIRLIASDVDGTILPRGGSISDRTRAAVHAAVDRGVPFVISSGRWYVSAVSIAEALALKEGYMIVANGGAVVRMNGEVLQEWTMAREDAQRAYDVLRRYHVMATAFVRNAVYQVNTKALGRPLRRVAGDYFGGSYRLDNDNQEAFEQIGLAAPYKMEAYAGPEHLEDLDRARAELAQMGYSLSSAYADNLEIMAPGCGKGTALRWLAQHLNVPLSECMAFGDNSNDVSMLSAVGWPIAVGNAVDALKAVARVVAPSDAEDGVAQMIEKALRGEIQ